MLLTSSTAFSLFFITLSLFPSTPKSTGAMMVQVKYSKHPVRRTEGQPLTLKCTAQFEEEHCGSISVFWCLSVPEKPCQPLIDPDRYLNHINETKLGRETVFRQQDAFVMFPQLTLNDTGFYQCKAVCQRSGATAMGHLINITVTGQKETTNIFTTNSNKGQKILLWSNQSSGYMLLLTTSTFILLWLNKK